MILRLILFLLIFFITACSGEDRSPIVTEYEMTDFSRPFVATYAMKRDKSNFTTEVSGAFNGKIHYYRSNIYKGDVSLYQYFDCTDTLVGEGYSDSISEFYNTDSEILRKGIYLMFKIKPSTAKEGKIKIKIIEYGYKPM